MLTSSPRLLGRAHRCNPDGFTLIELLVVIIIIGILASVAIPVFLNQRTKGYDTTAKSDLRNLATNEETYIVDQSRYGTINDIVTNGQHVNVTKQVYVEVYRYDAANGFCLVGTHRSSTHYFLYDSLRSGLSRTVFATQSDAEGACSLPATATPGDFKEGS